MRLPPRSESLLRFDKQSVESFPPHDRQQGLFLPLLSINGDGEGRRAAIKMITQNNLFPPPSSGRHEEKSINSDSCGLRLPLESTKLSLALFTAR